VKHVVQMFAVLLISCLAAASLANAAPNEDQCKVGWTIASPNGDALSADSAVPYIVDFSMTDSNGDAVIDASEFQNACVAGTSKFWSDVPNPDKDMSCRRTCCQGGICWCCVR